ncbi:MAG: DinB family protein [Planctomycetota bacterium]
MHRPESHEYGAYYGGYIDRVPDGDILATLASQREEFLSLVRSVPEERGGHRYAPGKWSIRELLGHLVDTERVLGYRALVIARGDATPLPGFEQDDYVEGGHFDRRTIADLADEFEALRRSHEILFTSFDDEVWVRSGTASESPFSTRALAWIMAGHVFHHADILAARYL